MLRNHGRRSVPRRLRVVEVPLGVGLQAHRELVEMLGHLVVAVEDSRRNRSRRRRSGREADDLVAATHVDLSIDTFRPSGWNNPGGDPPPGQRRRRVVETVDQPDVAVPGADGDASAAGEEVEPRGPHLAEPGITYGECQHVDGERSIVAADRRPASSGRSGHRDGPPRVKRLGASARGDVEAYARVPRRRRRTSGP